MMAARDHGILDNGLAGAVYSSRLNPKVMTVQKFGYNGDVDTSTEEDIWDVGGTYPWSVTPSKLSIVSDSADDSPGGDGLDALFIFGLDENFNDASELVLMNGLTAVETVNTYSRLYRMRAFSTGNGNENGDAAGNITASTVIDPRVQGRILSGNTSTKMSMYTVPTGYTGFISAINASGGPNDDFVIDLQLRSPGGVFVTTSDIEITNSAISAITYDPLSGPIPERTDVKAKAIAISNNAQVRVGYTVLLIRNDYLKSLAESI